MALSKNNKSGYTGVCFEKRANKWRAYITVGNEKIKIGYYSNLEEAVEARKQAEQFYKFKGKEGFRVIDYVIAKSATISSLHDEIYQRGKYGLISALLNYSWKDESFPSYAIKCVRNAVYGIYDPIPYRKFMLSNFHNDDIIVDWLNGNSIRKISASRQFSTVYVSSYIKKAIQQIKGEIVNE